MDILFLINLVMDVITFLITTMILNKPLHLRRILIAGAQGALLYCMLLIYPVLQQCTNSLWALLVPILPIIYLYRPVNFKCFTKYYLMSTAVAAFIGGVSFTIWYRLQYYFPTYKPTLSYIIGIGILIGVITYCSFYAIRKRFFMPYLEYEIEIQYRGKVEKIPALLDTGNRLYTPISHRPVLVVTFEAIKALLSYKECQNIEMCQNDPKKILEMDEGPRYIIPFHSMGCKDGLLWGIVSECVILYKSTFKRQLKECVIGIAFGDLCNDRDYKALLHPDFIINGGDN